METLGDDFVDQKNLPITFSQATLDSMTKMIQLVVRQEIEPLVTRIEELEKRVIELEEKSQPK